MLRKAEPSYALQQQQPLSQAKKNFTETEHNDAGADPMTLIVIREQEDVRLCAQMCVCPSSR
jgi:hypothetical protein